MILILLIFGICNLIAIAIGAHDNAPLSGFQARQDCLPPKSLDSLSAEDLLSKAIEAVGGVSALRSL